MAGDVARHGPRAQHSGKGHAQRMAEGEAILADHVKGMRTTELAAKYGVSHATASRRIKAALDARLAVTVDAYREKQNALLDELMADHERNLAAGTVLVQRGSMLGAEDPDLIERGLEKRQRALDGMLRVSERRAKLNGLDAPVRQEVEVVQVTQQEKQLRDLLEQAEKDQAEREAALIEETP